MKLQQFLKKLGACDDCIEYIGNQSALDAWNNCERGDWMLWIAKRQGVDVKVLTLAKVRCARLVEHLMKDDRSIAALVAAERFSSGEITREELDAASAAAYPASSADASTAYAASAYAASADAYAYAAAYAAAAYAYASAAYADSAAAYSSASNAAYAAARKETQIKCANICRETIPFELLKIEESL